jgi:hypothetical protein
VEIAFATQRLRAICEDGSIAVTEYDSMVVEQLQARLADLRAAESAHDLLAGDPKLDSNRLLIQLAHGFVLVAKPNHRASPLADDGIVDWRRVRRLQILEISR